ncbi:Uma2 family endonuclease [Kineococcus sp. LSe6-4]|uniref:Uma2 family endonuclease n=1 Tax=Kineococcus halophytocola TaxID=3234027 RepID=A0ABV4H3Q1_9ACTN
MLATTGEVATAAEMSGDAVSVLHREWVFEELLALPDDGYRCEILDGQLTVTPSPSVLHQDVIDDLRTVLLARVPEEWRLKTGVGVRMPRLGPERFVVPDLLGVSGPRPERSDEPEAVRLVDPAARTLTAEPR